MRENQARSVKSKEGGSIDRPEGNFLTWKVSFFFFKHAILKHISFVWWFSSGGVGGGILIKREWRAKGKKRTYTTSDRYYRNDAKLGAHASASGEKTKWRSSFVTIFNSVSNSSYKKSSPLSNPNKIQLFEQNLVFFFFLFEKYLFMIRSIKTDFFDEMKKREISDEL